MDAAFEQITHAQRAADFPEVDRLSLEGERRISSDDEKPAKPGNVSRQALGQSIGKVFLLRVAAHVLERENHEGRFFGEREYRSRRHLRGLAAAPTIAPCLHRFGNILELLWPHVVVNEVGLASYLAVSVIGYTDAAHLCDPVKPCGNVDAVAENIVVVDNDIAEMNSYSEFDPLNLRHRYVPVGHYALDFFRAADCVHRAGKLNQKAIAGRLDDPAVMRGDGRINHTCSDRL